MADICLRCGTSWANTSGEVRETCKNRDCRAVNWDKPRREWRTCPICGVSFEVDTGSRRIYDQTKCSTIAWDRRNRKNRGEEFKGEVDAGDLLRQGIEYGLRGME